MANDYGVLRGKVVSVTRENDFNSPHCQLRVIDGQNNTWRVPINVLSKDGSVLIFHRVDPLAGHAILAGLTQLPSKFNVRTPRNASTALDFVRSPLFDIMTTGLEAPHVGPQNDDDLQDILTRDLMRLKDQDGDVFVFGTDFPSGVHNIHMNQGNPGSGGFAGDNGIFKDGGLILRFPNRFVGLFLRFMSQLLPTDNQGRPGPNSRLIPAVGRLGNTPIMDGGDMPPPPPPPPEPVVYIERALVNPRGADPGREIVVLGNTTEAPIDVTGWSIVDNNGNAEVLRGIRVPAGGSRDVVLSGDGAQLTNRGGSIQLRDASGSVVHAVMYSRADATAEGRYIRFVT